MEDRKLFDAMLAVISVCEVSTPSLEDQLLVLEIAWVATARQARGAAVAIGGFVDEQVRQVARLEKIVERVKRDAPDLELERFFYDGDHEGVSRHLRNLMDDSEMDDHGTTP